MYSTWKAKIVLWDLVHGYQLKILEPRASCLKWQCCCQLAEYKLFNDHYLCVSLACAWCILYGYTYILPIGDVWDSRLTLTVSQCDELALWPCSWVWLAYAWLCEDRACWKPGLAEVAGTCRIDEDEWEWGRGFGPVWLHQTSEGRIWSSGEVEEDATRNGWFCARDRPLFSWNPERRKFSAGKQNHRDTVNMWSVRWVRSWTSTATTWHKVHHHSWYGKDILIGACSTAAYDLNHADQIESSWMRTPYKANHVQAKFMLGLRQWTTKGYARTCVPCTLLFQHTLYLKYMNSHVTLYYFLLTGTCTDVAPYFKFMYSTVHVTRNGLNATFPWRVTLECHVWHIRQECKPRNVNWVLKKLQSWKGKPLGF